jgi:hypothetical protein
MAVLAASERRRKESDLSWTAGRLSGETACAACRCHQGLTLHALFNAGGRTRRSRGRMAAQPRAGPQAHAQGNLCTR